MAYDFILQWFAENGAVDGQDAGDYMEKNYLAEGYIDSFGFLELVAACESRFSFSFSDSDFEDEKIFTICGLAGLVDSYAKGR